MFKQKIVTTYNKTLGKGVKYFTKKLQKFSRQSGTALEKSLFSIGKEISRPNLEEGKRKLENESLTLKVISGFIELVTSVNCLNEWGVQNDAPTNHTD